MDYQKSGTPLVIFAGKDYGMGSSRDWAAKGTSLLGVKAVIAESFERIHRSNLIGMGVLPCQFKKNENRKSLKLIGSEKISITGFLEDYAFCIEAFIKLYECTFEEKWLKISEKLLKYCFENFTNEENKMFYFTSKKQEKLIARKMELYDNHVFA